MYTFHPVVCIIYRLIYRFSFAHNKLQANGRKCVKAISQYIYIYILPGTVRQFIEIYTESPDKLIMSIYANLSVTNLIYLFPILIFIRSIYEYFDFLPYFYILRIIYISIHKVQCYHFETKKNLLIPILTLFYEHQIRLD